MAKYFVGSILLPILILFFDTPQSPRKSKLLLSLLVFPVVKGSGSFGGGLPIHEALMLATRLAVPVRYPPACAHSA